MANVIFKFGTRAQYDALITKEEHTLYWLSDTQELMKGSICYGKGSNATQQAAGLLSPEDKKKLDELSAAGVFNLAPVDASVIITDVADGKTIGVQLSKVEGNILTIKDDGLFAKVDAVPMESVTGLKERLEAIEQAAAGGVHYKGSVATFEELPVDAEQGDLWEVTADNSEWCWNGEKWFEYGSTSGLKPIARADYNTEQFEIDENNTLNIANVDASVVGYRDQALDEALPDLFVDRKYEITNSLFEDTLVNYRNGEIRVMFAKNSPFAKQQVGTNGDQNIYYMGFRAYAPDEATNFKEDLAEIISDNTLYSFTGNDFAGIDEYGRKYSIVWLPVAVYDESSDTWTYYGEKSSAGKYIGWYYSVEWYDADGTKIGADTIRINLSNESCHTSAVPYFMHQYAKVEDVQAVENAMKWQDI